MQLIDIKNFVADTIGTGDGSTSVPKRDRLINRARARFYSERKWSYLFKTATLTFTAYVADLPSDYNNKWSPQAVYSYSSNQKTLYKPVDWDDLDLYGTSDYVYAIDKANGHIKISSTSATLSIDYYYLPADKAVDTSDDTDPEPAPDITPIGFLALSMWYLSSRQKSGSYQLFRDEYSSELNRAIVNDKKPIRRFNRIPTVQNTGYNKING